MDKAIREKRAEILRIMGAHGARNPRIFGSVARGQDQPSSDIDVLVEMEPGRTLLDLVGLEQDLGATLGRHVDVVTDGGISPLPARSHRGRGRAAVKDDRAYLLFACKSERRIYASG